MILEAANGFLFVVCCQTGRILYVADSISPVLNLKQEDWLHHNISDLIHPDDTEKLRDQLCGNEGAVNKVLDLKTGIIVGIRDISLNFKGQLNITEDDHDTPEFISSILGALREKQSIIREINIQGFKLL